MFNPKSSYNKEELIACSNGELFTKEGDGRLPSDLMLMFDEIVNIDDFSGKILRTKIIIFGRIRDGLGGILSRFGGIFGAISARL